MTIFLRRFMMYSLLERTQTISKFIQKNIKVSCINEKYEHFHFLLVIIQYLTYNKRCRFMEKDEVI